MSDDAWRDSYDDWKTNDPNDRVAKTKLICSVCDGEGGKWETIGQNVVAPEVTGGLSWGSRVVQQQYVLCDQCKGSGGTTR